MTAIVLLRSPEKYYTLLIAVLLGCRLCAQPGQATVPVTDSAAALPELKYIVGAIHLNGNNHTRDAVVLRELPFHTGDEYTISDLVKKFEDARKQLMNTALFHHAIVAAASFTGHVVDVNVSVKERWYLFPMPYFKPVDRNLNQWLVEQKASFRRVNYGAKILYNNATGQNDKFRLWLMTGYTRQVAIGYDRLYIDKKMKWGARFNFAAGKNHELNFNTVNDKQAFLHDNNAFLRNFFHAQAELTYRRAINTRHSFGIGYISEQVHDTILRLNPEYFGGNRKQVRFPELFYTMTYYNLDYIPYPTQGFAGGIQLRKSGFNSNFNLWQLYLRAMANRRLTEKSFISLTAYAGIKLPFRQPYYNLRFLGYGDQFLQGYEYYVMDGVAGGYLRASLNRQLLSFGIPVHYKKRTTDQIPVRIYGKIFGNSGYVHNPQPGDNKLTNRMLHAAGLGIDIITFYDVIFRLEYSFNQLGQNGLYLHRKSNF